jgi:hypothetical protein
MRHLSDRSPYDSFGPVAQYHENSKYYSAVKPAANKEVDAHLPHITSSFLYTGRVFHRRCKSKFSYVWSVIPRWLTMFIYSAPSVMSIKKAMQTYARQGGSSSIFVHDDGLQLISEADRQERIRFYGDNGIGWVARPKHDNSEGGFKRRGRFKKASNMNYGLALSLKMEEHIHKLELERAEKGSVADSTGVRRNAGTGMILRNRRFGLRLRKCSRKAAAFQAVGAQCQSASYG